MSASLTGGFGHLWGAGNYWLNDKWMGAGAGPTAAGAPPPLQPPAVKQTGAPAMPTGTNLSPYFAPETPDAMMGSGVGGKPFDMGPGTAWPFGASWASILGNG